MSMVHVNGTSALSEHVFDFSADQQRMIRDTFANGASEAEFSMLLEVARARRLSPILKQIHFVKRWDSQKRRDVWSTQASIDGLRAIAERTGKYDGQDEPEYVERDGRIICCKVRVYRKDWTRPVVGVAYWDEYVQTTRDGAVTSFWKRMPHIMLAKCAEAIALRKAFPEDMSGLYTVDEMAQAERPRAANVTADGEVVEESDPDLSSRLAASVENAWPAWLDKHVMAFEAASDKGELLAAWANCNDEIKSLQPPSDIREMAKAAKDRRKAALS